MTASVNPVHRQTAIKAIMECREAIEKIISIFNDHDVHWKYMFMQLYTQIPHTKETTDEVFEQCKYLVEKIVAANSPEDSMNYRTFLMEYGERYARFLQNFKIKPVEDQLHQNTKW